MTAARLWRSVASAGLPIVTSDYVVLETCALVQRRLGVGALRRLDVRECLAFDPHFAEQGFTVLAE